MRLGGHRRFGIEEVKVDAGQGLGLGYGSPANHARDHGYDKFVMGVLSQRCVVIARFNPREHREPQYLRPVDLDNKVMSLRSWLPVVLARVRHDAHKLGMLARWEKTSLNRTSKRHAHPQKPESRTSPPELPQAQPEKSIPNRTNETLSGRRPRAP